MTVYRIRDWKKHFEKADHRKCAYMHWLSLPTKHDGKGFNRLARLPNAITVFGGWCLILQVAAKMPERGTLADADGPLTAQDLADKTHFPESVFAEALEACSNPNIGWIERIEVSETNKPGVSGPPEALRKPSGSPPESVRKPSGASGGNADSSGGLADSSGGNEQSSGASGESADSSGLHDKTRHNRQTEQIINNLGAQEGEQSSDKWPTDIDAENDSSTFGDNPEMEANRKRVYHAIRDTPCGAAFLSPKHLNDAFRFVEQFGVDEVCEAIRITGAAKVPRQGEAWVSYLAKVLASRAHERANRPKPAEPRTAQNYVRPVNVDGACPPPINPLLLARQNQKSA